MCMCQIQGFHNTGELIQNIHPVWNDMCAVGKFGRGTLVNAGNLVKASSFSWRSQIRQILHKSNE